MTHHLPPSLLALFAPRPPVAYLPPLEKRKCPPLSGIVQFTGHFEDPSKVDNSNHRPIETKQQLKERKIREKLAKHEEKIQELLKEWDPNNNDRVTSDPFKTLFVSRVNFSTTESRLRHEFEIYGPVKRVRMIHDINTGEFRGYAFIEFESKSDMQKAYKQADGKKIDGRRVLVDVERGRVVRNWRPRRLGGGLGATRAGGDDVNQKFSGREPPATPSGGSGERSQPTHRPQHRGGERDSYRPERKGNKDRDREREDRGDRENDRDRGQKRDRSTFTASSAGGKDRSEGKHSRSRNHY